MLPTRLRRFRFRLQSLFVLIIGVAIGYSLNLYTLQLLTGRAAYPTSLPPYVIEPPDILSVELIGARRDTSQVVSGQHLVGMDGRINLGTYGSVYVAGSTISEAQDAIKQSLAKYIGSAQVAVDVVASNSKVYYIIVQGQGGGDTVMQIPITGRDTVLDAIAKMGGLQRSASAEIWIARPAPNGVGSEKKLPIDWGRIASGGSMVTNHYLRPGDRLFIAQKHSSVAAN